MERIERKPSEMRMIPIDEIEVLNSRERNNRVFEEIVANITLAINFFVSLLSKNWQQVKRVYIKSTMGPSHRIYGF